MKVSHLIACSALAFALAAPAFALDVKKSVTVAASPEATWTAIGAFCGIADWHPAVAKCELSQAGKYPVRTLSLNGGGTIVEKQLSRSDAKLSYTYAITDSPLPVDHYKSTISVKKSGSGSVITWKGSFKAKGAPDAKVIEVVTGVYDGGLAALQKKLGQ